MICLYFPYSPPASRSIFMSLSMRKRVNMYCEKEASPTLSSLNIVLNLIFSSHSSIIFLYFSCLSTVPVCLHLV